MWGEDDDRACWNAAHRAGRRAFIETRILGFGVRLGLALAGWNAMVGGTFADYGARRLFLESAYYLAGSMALGGLGAALEWRHLARRFSAPEYGTRSSSSRSRQ